MIVRNLGDECKVSRILLVKISEFYCTCNFLSPVFLAAECSNQNNVVFKLSSNWKEQWKRKRMSEMGGIFENSIE